MFCIRAAVQSVSDAELAAPGELVLRAIANQSSNLMAALTEDRNQTAADITGSTSNEYLATVSVHAHSRL